MMEFLLGQVQPAGAPVFADVAQNVGHLQRHAQLDRVGDGVFAGEADDVHAHQPDGGGDAVAVCGELFEGFVANQFEIAGHSFDQLFGVARRHLEAQAGICPGGGDRVFAGGVVGSGAAAPDFQLFLRVVQPAVDNVVAHPAEGVEGACCPSFGGGQQP